MDPEHANRSAYIVQFPSGAIVAGCHHNSCSANDWHALRSLFAPGDEQNGPRDSGSMSQPETDWPRLGDLPSGRPAVPDLPEPLIPTPLLPWVADAAERTAVPIVLVAAPAIVALAAVVGRRVGINPKRRDDWLVVPNLWGATVARPGFLKTASAQEAARPLRRLAAAAQEDFQAGSVEAEANKALLDLQIAAVKERAKQAAKKGEDPNPFIDELSDLGQRLRDNARTERRYLTQDITVEKLGELLRENPRGLLVLRDEIAGWLRTLDKPGREGEREFFLEAWNGTGDFTFDRIARGTIHIPAVTISIFGTIQPAKLASYVDAALDDDGSSNDGLLQRFQILVWPDDLGEWRNVDRWPNAEARHRAFIIFQALDEISPSDIGAQQDATDAIPSLRFAPDAQELFDEWRSSLEQRLRSRELAETPAFESHLAKYRSLMPALALLFHLTELVDGGGPGPVSLEAGQRAAAWCDFLELHARKVYAAEIGGPQIVANALGKKIRDGSIQDGMPIRDVYRMGWSGLKSHEGVSAGFDVLTSLGWCRIEATDTGGRPSPIVRLHPGLRRWP